MPQTHAAQGGWRPELRADRMSASSVSTTRGRFAAGCAAASSSDRSAAGAAGSRAGSRAGCAAASSSDDDASSSGAAELPVPRTMRDDGAASTSMAALGDAMKP